MLKINDTQTMGLSQMEVLWTHRQFRQCQRTLSGPVQKVFETATGNTFLTKEDYKKQVEAMKGGEECVLTQEEDLLEHTDK